MKQLQELERLKRLKRLIKSNSKPRKQYNIRSPSFQALSASQQVRVNRRPVNNRSPSFRRMTTKQRNSLLRYNAALRFQDPRFAPPPSSSRFASLRNKVGSLRMPSFRYPVAFVIGKALGVKNF